jgi:hypothetical protein
MKKPHRIMTNVFVEENILISRKIKFASDLVIEVKNKYHLWMSVTTA